MFNRSLVPGEAMLDARCAEFPNPSVAAVPSDVVADRERADRVAGGDAAADRGGTADGAGAAERGAGIDSDGELVGKVPLTRSVPAATVVAPV